MRLHMTVLWSSVVKLLHQVGRQRGLRCAAGRWLPALVLLLLLLLLQV